MRMFIFIFSLVFIFLFIITFQCSTENTTSVFQFPIYYPTISNTSLNSSFTTTSEVNVCNLTPSYIEMEAATDNSNGNTNNAENTNIALMNVGDNIIISGYLGDNSPDYFKFKIEGNLNKSYSIYIQLCSENISQATIFSIIYKNGFPIGSGKQNSGFQKSSYNVEVLGGVDYYIAIKEATNYLGANYKVLLELIQIQNADCQSDCVINETELIGSNSNDMPETSQDLAQNLSNTNDSFSLCGLLEGFSPDYYKFHVGGSTSDIYILEVTLCTTSPSSTLFVIADTSMFDFGKLEFTSSPNSFIATVAGSNDYILEVINSNFGLFRYSVDVNIIGLTNTLSCSVSCSYTEQETLGTSTNDSFSSGNYENTGSLLANINDELSICGNLEDGHYPDCYRFSVGASSNYIYEVSIEYCVNNISQYTNFNIYNGLSIVKSISAPPYFGNSTFYVQGGAECYLEVSTVSLSYDTSNYNVKIKVISSSQVPPCTETCTYNEMESTGTHSNDQIISSENTNQIINSSADIITICGKIFSATSGDFDYDYYKFVVSGSNLMEYEITMEYCVENHSQQANFAIYDANSFQIGFPTYTPPFIGSSSYTLNGGNKEYYLLVSPLDVGYQTASYTVKLRVSAITYIQPCSLSCNYTELEPVGTNSNNSISEAEITSLLLTNTNDNVTICGTLCTTGTFLPNDYLAFKISGSTDKLYEIIMLYCTENHSQDTSFSIFTTNGMELGSLISTPPFTGSASFQLVGGNNTYYLNISSWFSGYQPSKYSVQLLVKRITSIQQCNNSCSYSEFEASGTNSNEDQTNAENTGQSLSSSGNSFSICGILEDVNLWYNSDFFSFNLTGSSTDTYVLKMDYCSENPMIQTYFILYDFGTYAICNNYSPPNGSVIGTVSGGQQCFIQVYNNGIPFKEKYDVTLSIINKY